jgi:uncharacterized protein (DUF2345 family)
MLLEVFLINFYDEAKMSRIFFSDIAGKNEEVSDDAPSAFQDCSDGINKYDEKFHLVDKEDNFLPQTRYRIIASTGEVFEGISDAQGFTQRIKTHYPADLSIEVFKDYDRLVGDCD